MDSWCARTPKRLDMAFLLLRIASAAAFLYHGSAILFGFFGGPGPATFALHHHWPVVVGYLVGVAQVAGGFAIATGVLIHAGAMLVAIVMLGAIFTVHLPHGFDINSGGFEYAFTQLLIALALLLTESGRYSLSSRLPVPLRKW